MLAAIAEFEKGIMLERQQEGISIAKANGKYKGRKPLPEEKLLQVQSLVALPAVALAAPFPKLVSADVFIIKRWKMDVFNIQLLAAGRFLINILPEWRPRLRIVGAVIL